MKFTTDHERKARYWCHTLRLWRSRRVSTQDEKVPRNPGCLCHWEEGDSPCPVHGEHDDG